MDYNEIEAAKFAAEFDLDPNDLGSENDFEEDFDDEDEDEEESPTIDLDSDIEIIEDKKNSLNKKNNDTLSALSDLTKGMTQRFKAEKKLDELLETYGDDSEEEDMEWEEEVRYDHNNNNNETEVNNAHNTKNMTNVDGITLTLDKNVAQRTGLFSDFQSDEQTDQELEKEETMSEEALRYRKRQQALLARIQRQTLVEKHQVHLLMWIARGRMLASHTFDEDFIARISSDTPTRLFLESKTHFPREDISYLVNWFRAHWVCRRATNTSNGKLAKKLITRPKLLSLKELQESSLLLDSKVALHEHDLVRVLAAVLRVLGLSVRIVLALEVLSFKPKRMPSSTNKTSSKKKTSNGSISYKDTEEYSKPVTSTPASRLKDKLGKSKSKSRSKGKGKGKGKGKVKIAVNLEVDPDEDNEEIIGYETNDDDDDDDGDSIYSSRKRGGSRKTGLGTKPKPKPKVKESLEESSKAWVEIYWPSENRWLPVNPFLFGPGDKDRWDESGRFEARDEQYSYVIAFCSAYEYYDVTLKYTAKYNAALSHRPGVQTAREWERSLWEGGRPDSSRARVMSEDQLRAEESYLEAKARDAPLPTAIGAYKGHPLYAIDKNLNQSEFIWPKEPIFGHVGGYAVYPRKNVRTLKQAIKWRKEGRIIPEGTVPLKQVKKRKSPSNRGTTENNNGITAELVGLFGEWQTVKPQLSKIGPTDPIPLNKFRNYELFHPNFLAPGLEHVTGHQQSLLKLAKELGIEHVQAMTGFEFRRAKAVPNLEGIIIHSKDRDLFMDAYDTSMAAHQQDRDEAQYQLVRDRWLLLSRKLLIRQRLRDKYLNPKKPKDPDLKKKKKKKPKKPKKESSKSDDDGEGKGKNNKKRKIDQGQQDHQESETFQKRTKFTKASTSIIDEEDEDDEVQYVSGGHQHVWIISDSEMGLWAKSCGVCGKIEQL